MEKKYEKNLNKSEAEKKPLFLSGCYAELLMVWRWQPIRCDGLRITIQKHKFLLKTL